MSWVSQANAGLLTDLYELTMAASYHRHGMTRPATFDLFVRSLPERRNFLVSCGLEQALEYLENLRFGAEEIEYLESLETFRPDFLEYLSMLRFTGDVWAIPEGELFFGSEPVLRVTAPLIEAQIVEAFLMNCIMFQSMIASKAARVAIACGDRQFVDFSLRRDHGADAALKGSRASHVGGAVATSNVLAAKTWGIPASGTMAHSYVMAFESEIEAFRRFASDFGDRTMLLIDTFDVEEGTRRAAQVAREMKGHGRCIRAVRIDSGDLGALAKSVRAILDDAGLPEVEIVLSGDLDEYRIAELVAAGAPADSFGVGTQLGTSGDEPALGGAYKLVEDERGPKIKLSTGKVTLPCRKQVWRVERAGRYDHDVIAREGETAPEDARPLLAPVMEGGRRRARPEGLPDIRERCSRGIDALPEGLRRLDAAPEPYPVRISSELEGLVARMRSARR